MPIPISTEGRYAFRAAEQHRIEGFLASAKRGFAPMGTKGERIEGSQVQVKPEYKTWEVCPTDPPHIGTKGVMEELQGIFSANDLEPGGAVDYANCLKRHAEAQRTSLMSASEHLTPHVLDNIYVVCELVEDQGCMTVDMACESTWGDTAALVFH